MIENSTVVYEKLDKIIELLSSFSNNWYTTMITTLIGAFFGGLFAFLFQKSGRLFIHFNSKSIDCSISDGMGGLIFITDYHDKRIDNALIKLDIDIQNTSMQNKSIRDLIFELKTKKRILEKRILEGNSKGILVDLKILKIDGMSTINKELYIQLDKNEVLLLENNIYLSLLFKNEKNHKRKVKLIKFTPDNNLTTEN